MRSLTGRLLVLVTLLGLLGACSSSARPPAPREAMAAKTEEAGEVTVEVAPKRIDERTAEFEVTLDTHTAELDQDLAGLAHLEVDGRDWGAASWKGDGPSGHHRSGTLGFSADGPARGDARLRLEDGDKGFDRPLEFTWRLG